MEWKWTGMPLDIENKSGTPTIQVKSSVAIELIAAIHYLSDRSHHSFSDKLANAMISNLSADSMKMLRVLSGMRLQGLELFEFIVKERAFDDVEVLTLKISGYENIDFIYTILGEVVDYNRIKQIIADRQELDKLHQEKPKLVNDHIKGFELLFYHTKKFKQDIVNLIKEMNNVILMNKLASLQEDYRKLIEKTEARLQGKKPIEVSQEIMEREFKKIFDFREFYFIPSYFISPHKIRVFIEDVQMVVFALEQSDQSINAGDRISNVFKIISDRTRLEILKAIIAGPTYGKLLAEKLNLTTATISHHVEVLKSVKLITEKRKKNIKYFEADEEEIKKFFNEGLEYLFKK